jgi:hypothetical protein
MERRLLCLAGVMRAFLAALVFFAAAAAPSVATAQINSRFAAGADFTIAASDRASTEDHAHAQFFPEPLWRFGTTDPGWGFHWGLNWYEVDIDRPVGGVSTVLGELHLRPIMAGYGYTWVKGRNAITADILGGFAFGSMELASGAADAYRSRLGLQTVDAEASNPWVLKPEVGIWHDINRSFGLNINIGYMLARPDVTITTSTGLDRRTARADQFLVKVGLVYSIF